MVNADLMDAIDRSLRQARQRRHEPFGGVQVVLFGDPYQLAPVPGQRRGARLHRRHLPLVLVLRREGVAGDAAAASSSSREIHRQAEAEFKYMLNAVRHGQVTAEIAGVLNATGARTPPDDGAITLATRNDTVNRINAAALGEAARPRAHGATPRSAASSAGRRTRPTRRSS